MAVIGTNSSYGDECIFLLEDLTGKINFTSFEEKEEKISNGVNYAKMLTKEELPAKDMQAAFEEELEQSASSVAELVKITAERIWNSYASSAVEGVPGFVLVSLARAGTPFGVLLRRFFKEIMNTEIEHYSISIIRGKGIDEKALSYIAEHHPVQKMVFVDGWTGKGSIYQELVKSLKKYNKKHGTKISPDLCVMADPAQVLELSGTRDDVCMPNAYLNATVSGLVSRTVYKKPKETESGFHGAVVYRDYASADKTMEFVDKVSSCFRFHMAVEKKKEYDGSINIDYLYSQMEKLFPNVDVRKKVKMGIGESLRAILRRKPVVFLINADTAADAGKKKNAVKNAAKKEDETIQRIAALAAERGIPVHKCSFRHILSFNRNLEGCLWKFKCAVIVK